MSSKNLLESLLPVVVVWWWRKYVQRSDNDQFFELPLIEKAMRRFKSGVDQEYVDSIMGAPEFGEEAIIFNIADKNLTTSHTWTYFGGL